MKFKDAGGLNKVVQEIMEALDDIRNKNITEQGSSA